MTRLHVHLAVTDLEHSIRFYSALFAAQPSVRHADTASQAIDKPAGACCAPSLREPA